MPIARPIPDVTALLLACRGGDETALARLVPVVERELYRIAERCMAGERLGHTLEATALVNEAYLRLVGVQQVDWQDPNQWLCMRHPDSFCSFVSGCSWLGPLTHRSP